VRLHCLNAILVRVRKDFIEVKQEDAKRYDSSINFSRHFPPVMSRECSKCEKTMDWISLTRNGPVAGSCERSNIMSGSIKHTKFVSELGSCVSETLIISRAVRRDGCVTRVTDIINT
jgi:hypothetical protein